MTLRELTQTADYKVHNKLVLHLFRMMLSTFIKINPIFIGLIGHLLLLECTCSLSDSVTSTLDAPVVVHHNSIHSETKVVAAGLLKLNNAEDYEEIPESSYEFFENTNPDEITTTEISLLANDVINSPQPLNGSELDASFETKYARKRRDYSDEAESSETTSATAKVPESSLPKPERWAHLSCHKGWDATKNNLIMGDIANFCDKYDDGKKDCFKLCLLRELGFLQAKFQGHRHKFRKIYDYSIPYCTKLYDRYSYLAVLLPGQEAEGTRKKIGDTFCNQCYDILMKVKNIPCSDDKWTEFHNCAEGAMKC